MHGKWELGGGGGDFHKWDARRERDRQTDRQTGRQAGRQAGRQTERASSNGHCPYASKQ